MSAREIAALIEWALRETADDDGIAEVIAPRDPGVEARAVEFSVRFESGREFRISVAEVAR